MPTAVITHSDGIPIVKPHKVVEKAQFINEKVAKVLPDEYYTKRIATIAKNRNVDGIRGLLHLESRPGLISLLAGKPHSSTFPITSLSLTYRDPTNPEKDVPIQLSQTELEHGLQYGPVAGHPGLVEWAYGLQEYSHGRNRTEGWRVSIGNGSQDLIYKAVNALVNPGDVVLIEAPVYAGILPIFQSLECDIIEVETDGEGISSSALRSILENWPTSKPKPKVLYTVPYGCNPTGMTATLPRRLEVLELARQHDFFILEDDPYHYLYYGASSRPPSYFALEKSQPDAGRVVRFDSLSKILSAGIRIGFVTAPAPIVRAIDNHSQTANLQPNSLSQVLALSILSRWSYRAFVTHTELASQFYREKRDVFEAAMRRHLTGLVEWTSPESGMFMWFKLVVNDDPKSEGDSYDVIKNKALERGVLALPGTIFYPSGRKTSYVRASFSVLSEEDVNEALRRLRETILAARA